MMYRVIFDGYLEHFGIKGMKWGIRRYQNEDGSLTPEGKRRLRKDLYKVGYIYSRNGEKHNKRFQNNPVLMEERKKLSPHAKRYNDAYNAVKKDQENYYNDKNSYEKDLTRHYRNLDPEDKDAIMKDKNIEGRTYDDKIKYLVQNASDYDKNVAYYNYRVKENKETGRLEGERAKAYENWRKQVSKTADRLINESGDLKIRMIFDDEFPENDENRKEAMRIEKRLATYSIEDVLNEELFNPVYGRIRK